MDLSVDRVLVRFDTPVASGQKEGFNSGGVSATKEGKIILVGCLSNPNQYSHVAKGKTAIVTNGVEGIPIVHERENLRMIRVQQIEATK